MANTRAKPNIPIWLANQQEVKNMMEAWIKANQAFHQTMEQEIKSCFFSIRVKIMIKTLQHLHQDHRLARHDAEIFLLLEQWMQEYRQIIKTYQERQKDNEDSEIGDRIEGIFSILLSQYQQFYEDGPIGINPILLEKEKYISHTKQNLVAGLKKIEEEFIKDIIIHKADIKQYQKSWLQQDQIREIYQQQVEQWYQCIWEHKKQDIYNLYQEVSLAGMQQIDDFNKRPMLHQYYEFAQNQKNTLESICTVQQDLEDLVGLLNGLYIQMKEKNAAWEQGFKNGMELNKKILNQDDFYKYIQEEGIEKYVKDIQSITEDRVLEHWHEFYEGIETFKSLLNIVIEEYDALFSTWLQEEKRQWIKGKEKEEKAYEQMVRQIITSFQEFQRLYQEQKEELVATQYKDIFIGIDETLEIKIQSIQEQQEQWAVNIKKIYEKNLPPYEEKLNMLTLYNQWIQLEEVYTEESSNLVSILARLLENDWDMGVTKDAQEQWESWVEGQEHQWDKVLKNQLKNHLLFEISTFEEILYYSISRIREEPDEKIIHYVKGMDDLTQKLYDALEAYGISFIRPEPYEKFNGKEQEVLLAEEQEGFQKGDIIKCINTGYRYQGQVLLRANVIAAR